MKQLITIALLAALSSGNGWSQTSKGSLSIGASQLYSSVNIMEDNPVYKQSVQPRIGYFVRNNIQVGLCVEVGTAKNATVRHGLTIYTRLYTGRTRGAILKPFMEMGGGVADRGVEGGYVDSRTSIRKSKRSGCFHVNPGFDLFLGRSLAIEVAAEYRHINGEPGLDRLGVSAGLHLFFTGASFTKLFPYKFKSMH